jgi:hypothetical protein
MPDGHEKTVPGKRIGVDFASEAIMCVPDFALHYIGTQIDSISKINRTS